MRIPELDGLRAIAILLVLGCHYVLVARQLGGVPAFGWLGVDVFFALSGYLITTVLLGLRDRPDALRVFYQRRALRILPPYVVALAFIYALSIGMGEKTLLQVKSAVTSLLFLQSFQSVPETVHQICGGSHALIVTGPKVAAYGIAGNIASSLSIFWSLSVEEYFYVLWAPVVLFCHKSRAASVAIVVCAIEFAIRWSGYIGEETYFSGLHRFDALMYGALVALALSAFASDRRLRPVLIRVLFASVGVIALVFFWMGPSVGREIRESSIFMVFGMPALAIAMAAIVGLLVLSTGHRVWALLRCGPMRFVGRISYMLYLIHAPIYLLLRHVYGASWSTTAIAFGAAVGLCWLSWRYMEEPLLRRKEQERTTARQTFSAAQPVSA